MSQATIEIKFSAAELVFSLKFIIIITSGTIHTKINSILLHSQNFGLDKINK